MESQKKYYDSSAMAKETDSIIQLQARQRKLFERRWYDNNFFDDGFHYRYVSRTTGKIVDLTEQGSTHIPQRAIPKASRQIRGIANLLLANEFVPVIYPEKVTQANYPDPAQFEQVRKMAQDTASKTGNWIMNEWNDLSLKTQLTLMVLLTSKHSISYLKIYPDAVKEKINVLVRDAFDIYVKSTGYSIYESPYIIDAQSLTLNEIKANENFDEVQLAKLNPDNRYASSEIKQAYMQTRFGYILPTESTGTVMLKEGYFKEYISDDNIEEIKKFQDDGVLDGKSKGDQVIRQVFSAGGIWLSDKYVNLKEYPFVYFRMEPGTIYQVPLIERFIPTNKSLDSVVSRLERHIGTQIVGAWLKRRGEQFKISNIAGGQVIEYDGVAPTQAQMAPIPAHVMNFIELLEGFISEQGANTATSNSLPTGVKSNVAIENLKASEYANLKMAADQLKLTTKRIAERMLELADNFFTKPHEVEILDQGKPNYFDVIGSKALEKRKALGIQTQATPIKGDTRVDIEIESGLGFTEEGKRNTMIQMTTFLEGMAQQGYLTQDAVRVVIKRFLDVFKFGNLQEFMEALDSGTQSAPLTNDQITQMKIAVLEALKESGEIGQQASEKRISENKIGSLQAMKDAGLLNKQDQTQADKKPSESISFKDLPAEGQAQMAAQAGIQLSPEQIKVDQQNKQVQATKMQPKGLNGAAKNSKPTKSKLV
jgi:hypothetical protein